jgi:hypothetical protein
VSSLGTYVPGVAAGLNVPVGRCVSSADTSLSLSLSLSAHRAGPLRSALTGRPGSPVGGGVRYDRNGLTAKSPLVTSPLAGYGTPRLNARCSKLPCHALDDVRRPHKVTRDRNSAYTHANVRQAHRERTCRAPGGVAGPPHASSSSRISFLPRALSRAGRAVVSRAPRGVAGRQRTSLSYRARTCRAPGGVAEQPRARVYRCACTSRSSFQPSACIALGAGTLDSQEER